MELKPDVTRVLDAMPHFERNCSSYRLGCPICRVFAKEVESLREWIGRDAQLCEDARVGDFIELRLDVTVLCRACY